MVGEGDTDREFIWKRGLPAGPVQVFETGGRTVTEADVVSFAGLSGDYNCDDLDPSDDTTDNYDFDPDFGNSYDDFDDGYDDQQDGFAA